MSTPFQYPCAVELEGLTREQVVSLEGAFVKLGAELDDSFAEEGRQPGGIVCWVYYGVDYCNTTQCYNLLHHYAREDEEVTLYTYEEVMEMVNISKEEATSKYTGATDSEGWILNTGTEPQYLLDGGKVDVKFVDGIVITEVTNDDRYGNNENVERGAHTWIRHGIRCDIAAWKPSVASSVDDTAILEPEVYTDSQEDEVSPKAIIGASVDITINVTIDGRSWGITRDEAFKLFKDLKDIFEEKVI